MNGKITDIENQTRSLQSQIDNDSEYESKEAKTNIDKLMKNVD